MRPHNIQHNGIPISVSLDSSLRDYEQTQNIHQDKKRLVMISAIAILIAFCISLLAKLLVYLINFITNISFHKNFSFAEASPAHNSYGIWVIIVPVVGGLIVGLIALYGSKAIRGHGIPEAMEQILVNESKIKPSITYLKPLSAAISIGTGGPFGAEGPIIATGGALGSTLGQLLKISHNERKILLAAGATAGMAAIFGSPIAAMFLAIELLLFEFSPRSFIPVALACITGAAGHHLLFGSGVVFPIAIAIPTAPNMALTLYGAIGIVIGLLSVGVTKIVYWIEDVFEKLPIHWAFWPAIGGLFVGVIGYYNPLTLGVGYSNITNLLSGTVPMAITLSLCIFKFLSWAISLGSGTSGGTLAPLLTIGGATGALLGSVILYWFPLSGVSISLAALVGMSAMFAGASRAFLTSIVFALETTGQSNALLPLLATCTTAYCISYFLMENTIMTEKIARRGVKTPDSYEPDILDKYTVVQVLNNSSTVICDTNTVNEVREWANTANQEKPNYYIISTAEGEYKGIVSASNLFSHHHLATLLVGNLIKRHNFYIHPSASLKAAIAMMGRENVDVLPVVSEDTNNIIGVLSYTDIISVFKQNNNSYEKKNPHISIARRRLRILVRGQRFVTMLKGLKE
jgi:CIC family chloride channel protein